MDAYKERLMKARQIGVQVLIQMQDNRFQGYWVQCMGQ